MHFSQKTKTKSKSAAKMNTSWFHKLILHFTEKENLLYLQMIIKS